jgi:protein SDA1
MPEFLLSDLIQYKSYKDKGVSNGARSLIQLFRDVNPEMLPKKDRGKMASLNIRDKSNKKAEFGHTDVHQRIEGAEILDSLDSSNNAFEDETQGMLIGIDNL